ncbi:Vacuolar protein sorting-associated protein 13D [Aphelenchoides bicaudatus]|nr:Vacuolar protein sorting-associated protein 13D [Aphelenchoides bicaudatus]
MGFGQVELENVPLRKTALQKFDIPLEVRSGVIGKLTLSIPITHIKSEPWVLKISDLLVLLGPNKATDSVEVVEKYEQTRKEQMLEELEKLQKKHLLTTACLEQQAEDNQNSGWWGASLVSAVSNNIQLILDNVHIRYEDDQTMPDKQPFNFGFRIQNISIQTTNSQWKPGFVQPDDGSNIFKKLDIKGFSVFWNCAPSEIYNEISNLDELKQLLCPLTNRNNTYILQPFSMQVRMEKNTSKFPLKQQPAIPRFKFDLRPETIELELSKRQLAQIQVLTSEWSRFDRARQHRKWRPSGRVAGNAKEWWQFAYGRILEQNRRQRTTAPKTFVVHRAKLLNNYCRSYRRRLRAFVADEMAKQQKKADPTAKVASASATSQEDIAYMKQIEHDSQFSYAELQLFRETVFRRYIKELETQRPFAPGDSIEVFELVSPESEPNRNGSVAPDSQDDNSESTDVKQKQEGGGLYGWVASWFGATPTETDSKEAEDLNKAALLDMWPTMEFRKLPPNLRKIEKNIEAEILDVLSESWDDSTTLRRDTLLAELVVQLEKMIIRFVDDDELLTNGRSRVLALDMRQFASRVLLSPREHRTEVMLSVGEMSVQRLRIAAQMAPRQAASIDLLTEEESLFYGIDSETMIEPEILFAIGRTKEAEVELSAGQENSDVKPEPFLQLFYRRLAPRMNIFHEVKARLLPVSIIYDEDALDGLSNLFDTESAFDADLVAEQNKPGLTPEYDPHVQLFLTINVPEVLAELRTKRLALDRETLPNSSSAAFAFVNYKWRVTAFNLPRKL